MKEIKAKTIDTTKREIVEDIPYEPSVVYDEPVTEAEPDIVTKGKFSKHLLGGMLIFLLIFTTAVLFISYKTGSEPSTLVTCVFAFCSVEGGYLAWIKIMKTKTGGNE